MLYKLTKQIRENGGATKEDLKELEPFLSTGPIKFDNSRFYKNVEFIKQNYDILDYVTREIDVSYIKNEKLAELVFYLNVLFGKTSYDVLKQTFIFETSNNSALKEFFKMITSRNIFWDNYYSKNEDPFIINSFQGIHNIMASHLAFHFADEKILDLLLSLIYTEYIFKKTEALPRTHYSSYPAPGYDFFIDNRVVTEIEFKTYRNKVSKFLDKMTDKYKIDKESK